MIYTYREPKELNEFQKKKIIKRLKMDFFFELDKMNKEKEKYSKVFREQIDILISKLDNKGVMFFGFKIEMPFMLDQKKNMWESVHEDIEEFLNFMGCHIELIEFCYMSIEVHNRNPKWQKKEKEEIISELNGLPFISGIFGVRSILGENTQLLNEMKELFLMSFFDIKVEWLKNCIEIKNYWNFIIKENNYKFHRFVNYSDFFYETYGAIADEEIKFEDQQAFGQENHFISETMNISGVQSKYPSYKVLIIYLLNLYFLDKNYRIFEDKIYSRILKSKFSWQVVFSLEDFRKNYRLVFEHLQTLYPQQLKDFNFTEMVLEHWDSLFDQLKKNNNFFLEKLIDDDIIEFNDGVFFLKENKFYNFNKKFDNLNTIMYLDINFSSLNSVEIWLKLLFDNLQRNSFISLINKFKKV